MFGSRSSISKSDIKGLRQLYRDYAGVEVADADIEQLIEACQQAGMKSAIDTLISSADFYHRQMSDPRNGTIRAITATAQKAVSDYRLKQGLTVQEAHLGQVLALLAAITICYLFLRPIVSVLARKIVDDWQGTRKSIDGFGNEP